MPKFISWNTASDGTLVESDLKFFPGGDGTYDIETTAESIGFILGLDKVSNKYTVVLDVVDKKKVQKMKTLISIGDILVSVNERVVLEEPYASVVALMEILIKGGYKRRLKFLNPKKVSVVSYMQKLEQSGKLQTDMLGFNCSFEYKLDERAFRAANQTALLQRDLEWVEYLKSIGGPENLKPAGIFKPSPDLKAIVRRGIPVAFRATVWQRISLSNLYRAQHPEGYYQSLLERVGEELNSKVKNDIEKDVDRTFPEHVYFEPSGQGESGLRRVLQAFALHNPEVGYCQSLNFVAGMMLIFMQEEEAFWLLVTIVEKLLPADYYTRSMVGTYVDQFVLAHIIKKCLPRIHSTFEANQLQLPLITVQWFMCLFVNTLRPEVTLRVWDMFLNEGSKVLFRIAAALFKLHEPQLLAVKDAADLFSALRTIGKNIVDADVLIAAAYKTHPKTTTSSSSSSASTSATAAGGGGAGGSVPPSPTKGGGSLLLSRTRSSGRSQLSLAERFVNPRLKRSSSQLGMVPKDLTGLGLAHVGPVKAGEAAVAASNAASSEKSVSNSSVSSSTNNDEDGGSSSSPSSPSNVIDKGYLQSHIGELNNVDFNPSVAASSPSTSTGGLLVSDRFSSEYLTPEKLKNRKSSNSSGKRSGSSSRNGDLSFYRADILLWRASFRPALEERHVKMEAARRAWSSKQTSNSQSTPNKTHHHTHAHGQHQLGSSSGDKAERRRSSSSAAASLSTSNSSGTGGTPAKRPSVLASLSVDMSVLSDVLPEANQEQQQQGPLSVEGSPVRADSFKLSDHQPSSVGKVRSESISPIAYMEQIIPISSEYDIDYQYEEAGSSGMPSSAVSVTDENSSSCNNEEEEQQQQDESPSLLSEVINGAENGSIIPTYFRASFTSVTTPITPGSAVTSTNSNAAVAGSPPK